MKVLTYCQIFYFSVVLDHKHFSSIASAVASYWIMRHRDDDGSQRDNIYLVASFWKVYKIKNKEIDKNQSSKSDDSYIVSYDFLYVETIKAKK